jgi:hypothetical protein
MQFASFIRHSIVVVLVAIAMLAFNTAVSQGLGGLSPAVLTAVYAAQIVVGLGAFLIGAVVLPFLLAARPWLVLPPLLGFERWYAFCIGLVATGFAVVLLVSAARQPGGLLGFAVMAPQNASVPSALWLTAMLFVAAFSLGITGIRHARLYLMARHPGYLW